MRSSSAGSAQCASSKASASGRRVASVVRSIRKAHGAASAEASPPRPRADAIVAAAARPSPVAGMTEVSGRPRSAWSTISRSGQ